VELPLTALCGVAERPPLCGVAERPPLRGVDVRPLRINVGVEIEVWSRGAGAGLGDRKENIVGVDERSLLLARILLPSLLGVGIFSLIGRYPIVMARAPIRVPERDALCSGVLERPRLPVIDCKRLALIELGWVLDIWESACEQNSPLSSPSVKSGFKRGETYEVSFPSFSRLVSNFIFCIIPRLYIPVAFPSEIFPEGRIGLRFAISIFCLLS